MAGFQFRKRNAIEKKVLSQVKSEKVFWRLSDLSVGQLQARQLALGC